MEERRLIFCNILNKVPLENIGQAFNKSLPEITAEFNYIIQKIKNYCFLNAIPAFECDSIAEAQKNRNIIYSILPKLNLEKSPEFKIRHQSFRGMSCRGKRSQRAMKKQRGTTCQNPHQQPQ